MISPRVHRQARELGIGATKPPSFFAHVGFRVSDRSDHYKKLALILAFRLYIKNFMGICVVK